VCTCALRAQRCDTGRSKCDAAVIAPTIRDRRVFPAAPPDRAPGSKLANACLIWQKRRRTSLKQEAGSESRASAETRRQCPNFQFRTLPRPSRIKQLPSLTLRHPAVLRCARGNYAASDQCNPMRTWAHADFVDIVHRQHAIRHRCSFFRRAIR
jgi:hypothetical protein